LLEKFKSQGLKRQERVNKMYDLIESKSTKLTTPPKTEYASIVMASDGFFPFSDNIHHANEYNVSHIIQPGGSTADKEIDAVCEKYNITHIKTGRRLFYH
jgi:AICAR transformylase/IMP cyclohydrolase PurH